MLMKDECKKVKEREKYQNNLNKLKINYDQTSIEIKKKQMIIFAKKNRNTRLKKRMWEKNWNMKINGKAWWKNEKILFSNDKAHKTEEKNVTR